MSGEESSDKDSAICLSSQPSPPSFQLADKMEFPSLGRAPIAPPRRRWVRSRGQDASNCDTSAVEKPEPPKRSPSLPAGPPTLPPRKPSQAVFTQSRALLDPSFFQLIRDLEIAKVPPTVDRRPALEQSVSWRFRNDTLHPITNEANSAKKSLNVDSPSFTPTQLQPGAKKFTFSSQAANAAPFTPKAVGNSSQFNPYAEDPTGMAGGSTSFYPAQGAYAAPIQPLQYHLYAPVGPYRSDLSNYQRQAHDFFLREDIREEMQKKSEATRQVLPGSQLPSVAHYHSLVPLDSVRGGKSIFGDYLTWLYKADSKKNGNIYCLRRLQGVRSITKESVSVIARWKRINCGNVVSVIECFTSRDFNDMSLIFIHNYHPLSKTLAEHHFNTNNQGRYARPPPVPESVLWSYICQMCNALKAIHSENLAARCIDLSKVILTDRNRIRLSACAIQDVLEHETAKPILDLQLEDFVQLGRMILSIGTNTATLHNLQASMVQFGGMYSQELRDRVIWLLTTPQTPEQATQKTVHELARGISDRILDSFDSCLHASDETNSNLYRELENGRVARLMMKLGAINERPEFENDPSWSENGERYQLKLFRDYVFHQVDASGNPVVDMAHILSCLNKLDAGSEERVYLTSRDHQTAFVVTYRELKKQVASAFNELLKPSHSKQPPRGY
ncbi:Pab-dependent poly(A)-specific ribonuclease subunit PAN3 [Apiospora phragmitis]|uniref:PAN2-PAN3 deadenylation complex subunit PAN3 n=1 Tax=Apiospora phragmitis TaxID=2905665 RepID=A0ABR1VSQ5_9PEZI